MKDCELKITFDRAAVENALVKIGEPTTVCKTLEIKDCVAITEYVSSLLDSASILKELIPLQ